MKSYVRDLTQLGLLCALLASCSDTPATATPASGTAGTSPLAGSAGQATGGSISGNAGNSGTATAMGGSGGSSAGSGGTTAATAGSGGTTAGNGDVAGAGGNGDPAACKPEWALCDGFEGAVPGSAESSFQIVTHYTATVEVASDKFAHGQHSMHIKIPDHGDGDPDGTAGYIAETKTFPAAKNSFWGRMLVYFHPATGLPEQHWANVQASGTKNDPGYDLLRVGGGNRAPGIMNTNQYPPDSFGYSQTQVIPVDKWSCWEWQMDGENPQATNVHFFIDETEVTDVAVVNGKAVGDETQKFVAPQFQKVELGFQFWHDDHPPMPHFTGGDMWIDDVVIDDARIHCPAK